MSSVSSNVSPLPEVGVASPGVSSKSSFRRNPYRLFFPMGMLCGLFGVGLWLPWSLGLNHEGIGLSHSLIMSQAFLSFFAAGFLMTAFPWLSGSKPASPKELAVISSLSILFVLFALKGLWIPSEIVFLLFMGGLCLFVTTRIIHRTKSQPQFFFLLGCGLVSALCGTGLVLAGLLKSQLFQAMAIGRQLMQLGFMLFLVLGATRVLGPIIMGHTNNQGGHCQGGKIIGNLFIPEVIGIMLFMSFLLDPFAPQFASWMRALLVTFYQMRDTPIWRPIEKKNVVNFFFQISCWMVPVGLWLIALLPQFKVAGLHLVFIGGFGLMIFSFGLFVAINHSNHRNELEGRPILLRITGTVVMLAALGRFIADFISEKYVLLVGGCALLWVLSSFFWLIDIVPRCFELPKKPIYHENA